MEQIKHVKATDTLRIHFTTIGNIYEVIDQDDECYKIKDDRGIDNWIPFRYLEVIEEE